MRALIFDLDDTLLGSEKQVSAVNTRALLDADAAGYQIIIATSRPIRAVRTFVPPEIVGRSITISLNGAVVHLPDPAAERTLFSDITSRVPSLLEALGATRHALHISVETDGDLFACNEDMSPHELWRYHSARAEMLIPMSRLHEHVISKLAVDGMGRAIPDAIGLSREYRDLRFIPALDATLVNIVAGDVDKSTTLQAIAVARDIDLAASIAFGDDLPDVDLFSSVGMAVAMGNAKVEVKAAADLTIGHCDSNAIAQFLHRKVFHS